MGPLESKIDKICTYIASKLEKRTFKQRCGKVYLERYYFLHSNRFKFLPGIYLHKFLESDEDYELHSHPWGTSISLILTGGYLEERKVRNSNQVNNHFKWPGSFNILKKDTFHRVSLLDNHVWTLFISGDKKYDWGFWDQETGKYLPWKKFHNQKWDDAYSDWLMRLKRNPDIMAGAYVFPGTRLTVNRIGNMVKAGESADRILNEYPYLDYQDLVFACRFVELSKR